MIASAGVLAVAVGIVLVWAAIADESPAEVVRSAFRGTGAPPSDSPSGGEAPDASTGIGPQVVR